jgi:hypothetical protein
MDVEGERSSWLFALYFFFKVLPVLVGAGSIYLGYRLFILGVTGQASLSVQSATVSGQLLNAAPGLFFAIGGIAIVLLAIWKGVDIVQRRRRPPVEPPHPSDRPGPILRPRVGGESSEVGLHTTPDR